MTSDKAQTSACALHKPDMYPQPRNKLSKRLSGVPSDTIMSLQLSLARENPSKFPKEENGASYLPASQPSS
ncbi:hypothetical protein E2P81_ATG10158 [Venturia nashicola]|nr:hypothetical protein E2P81_ATG10158 [Venturia nashicola]